MKRLKQILPFIRRPKRSKQLIEVDPLEAEMAQAKQARESKAAATKVDFFTLVRGED